MGKKLSVELEQLLATAVQVDGHAESVLTDIPDVCGSPVPIGASPSPITPGLPTASAPR
ncbi:hypothetical protein [Mycolicibacterium mengxianglii]|uniref:hypothetical protein n=1 Tax=Mycolicibacterium mengxianglii TaxID=2736649 RepID=UPI0018EEDF36|nr:hypothetical protein [Mycolicibacterium mengxianglii]